MKHACLVAAVLLTNSLAFAQGKVAGDHKMKEIKEVKTSTAPVTHAEAVAVFGKAWKSLATGLKARGTNPVKMVADAKPVTKNEVLAAFKAFVVQTQPMFKRSATKVGFNKSRIRKDMDMNAFGILVSDGFVMPVGPLVVGKNGTLSTYEFGDAVGVLLIRIADLAHMPSRKFSPALMPDHD